MNEVTQASSSGAFALRAPLEASERTLGKRLDVADLFVRLSRRVYTYACWHVRDPAAAEDVVSTVFERVFRSLDRFDPARSAPEDWLFAIAVNVVRDYHRARRWGREVPLESVREVESAGPTAEDAAIRRERLERLRAVMVNLRPREREVLTLKLVGRLSNASIGRLCHLRPGHVAVVVHRAVCRLREMLKEQEEPR
jgi:RNA polymerase sigma-70 factor (ECF subfamily)